MGFLSVFICSLLLIFSYLLDRKIYSPGVAFFCLFLVITSLSLVGYKGVAVPNDETYCIVILGCIGFFIGNRLAKRIKLKRKQELNYNFSDRNYYILIIASFFLSYFVLKTPIKILLSGGNVLDVYKYKIASVYIEDMIYQQNQIEGIITTFLANPLILISMYSSLVLLFFRKNRKYAIPTFYFLGTQVISTGGRTVTICILICAILGVYELTGFRLKNLKIRYIILLVLLLGVFMYLIMVRNSDIIETIYKYYGYALIHMQMKLELLEPINYTIFLTTLQGFLRPVFSGLSLFNIEFEAFNYATNSIYIADAAIYLNNGISYNAFVTLFYYFFVDLGFIGVYIYSFIFGLACQKLYNSYIKEKNMRNVLLYWIVFCHPICFAVVRFQFVNVSLAYAYLIASFVLFRHSKITRRHL